MYFVVRLINEIFTVDNYILKKKINVSPVKIAIYYSFVEHNFIISYFKMLIILLFYTSILKENIFFVNLGSSRYGYLSHAHRHKSILRGNIDYKAIKISHDNINSKVHFRSYSKALIIKTTHRNSTTRFESLKLTHLIVEWMSVEDEVSQLTDTQSC